MEAEHEKFPVDARRTPGGILRNHQEDQFTDLLGDSPPPPTRFCTLQSMVQYRLNPARCHRATVSGRTRKSDFSQSDQRWRTTTQNSLSNAPSLGLGCLRFNTASCWRSARFSNIRLRCARKMRITAPHQSRNRLNMAATVADWLGRLLREVVDFSAGQNCGEGQA